MSTLFMLATGQHVVADILEETPVTFIVENPMLFVYNSGTGRSMTSIYTMKFMPLVANSLISINKSAIVACGAVTPEVDQYYIEMVRQFAEQSTKIHTDYGKDQEEITKQTVDSFLEMAEKANSTIH